MQRIEYWKILRFSEWDRKEDHGVSRRKEMERHSHVA